MKKEDYQKEIIQKVKKEKNEMILFKIWTFVNVWTSNENKKDR